jgi:hypothetical protein
VSQLQGAVIARARERLLKSTISSPVRLWNCLQLARGAVDFGGGAICSSLSQPEWNSLWRWEDSNNELATDDGHSLMLVFTVGLAAVGSELNAGNDVAHAA